jgi:two-component system, OmpR family, heavy metal sensor histidine kinase CusS
MSLNDVHGKAAVSGSRRSLSIAQRLISITTLSAFCILIIIESFLYYALVGSLEHENRNILIEKIQSLRSLIRERPDDRRALRQELVGKIEQQHLKYYARISDEQDIVLADNFEKYLNLSAGDFPPPVGVDRQPEAIKKKPFNEDGMLLLMAAWAQGSAPAEKKYLIQAAVDISHEAGILRSYRLRAAAALIVGLLVSGAAVAFISRRSLMPLVKITRVIQRIRATKLARRVNPSQWPKELRELATSFDEMLDRLQDSFIRLSEFSSDLAHELRTPISNLIGEAEVALSRTRTVAEYQQHIGSSLEELQKLAHIIENLLFIAKTESTDIKIAPELLEPCKEIDQVLDYADAFREERNITVSCTGSAALYADRLLFRRAMTNIISNALRYTPPGGELHISVSTLPDYSVAIAIRDTGIGIAPEDLPKIFNRFHRGDNAKALDAEGAGLGLAIVKSIIDMHDGTIDIASVLSQGTTVTLTFPPLA